MEAGGGAIFAVVSPVSPSLLALVLAGSAAAACRAKPPVIDAPFNDDFERSELGANWNATSPEYRVTDGKLTISNGSNHPAWLRRRLPNDVAIEVDVTSMSPSGDIKLELFGDGESFDPDKGGYVSSGYVLIFGGWNNSLSVICRNNEHDEGRKAQRADVRVEPGRRYHFSITRRSGAIDWSVDGNRFLAWTDPAPLSGAGHEYLAVNDWQAELQFDNLQIRRAR